MDKAWYEVWADEGPEVPYLLLVVPEDTGPSVLVLDPSADFRVVHRAEDYENARFWLAADEYELVCGRMVPD